MLTQPCPGGPASQYGIENLKSFRDGRISHNKPMPADEFSYQDSVRATECPVSDFGHQLINDFPSITAAEAKEITRNLLRCAAHAASLSGSGPTTTPKLGLLVPRATLLAVNLLSAPTSMLELSRIVNSSYKTSSWKFVRILLLLDLSLQSAPSIARLEKGSTGWMISQLPSLTEDPLSGEATS